jgi:hypothetical protein
MKSSQKLTAALTSLLALASPAFAAAGAREDNSDFVVWVFLAFCALIVIGQMFPMIKNLKAHKPQVEQKEVKEKA